MDGFVDGVVIGAPAVIEAVGLMRVRIRFGLAVYASPLGRRRGDSIVLREICQALVDTVLTVPSGWGDSVADVGDQAC